MPTELTDAERLRENVLSTHARLAADPGLGRVRPWVSTRLEQDVRAVARFVQYDQPYEFRCDESVDRAGLGSAPSPMRYLLSSLAFCMQGWCAKVAALKGAPLEDLQIDIRTLLDMRGEHFVDDTPSHPEWFVVDIRLSSPAASEVVAEIAQEAARRCPISSLLRAAVPIYLLVNHNGHLVLDERPEDLSTEHQETLPR